MLVLSEQWKEVEVEAGEGEGDGEAPAWRQGRRGQSPSASPSYLHSCPFREVDRRQRTSIASLVGGDARNHAKRNEKLKEHAK